MLTFNLIQARFNTFFKCDLENHLKSGYSICTFSLNMAGSETGSDTTMSDQSLPQTYQLKTMCLAKKTAQMPTKEEHGFLLFCGLGARKGEGDMNCNSLTFKQAILNIYPRLRSVIGYNLYTVSKDKKHFERIPEKVNTPKRIRSYLGPLFTGCLIIVPVSDIVLVSSNTVCRMYQCTMPQYWCWCMKCVETRLARMIFIVM